MEATEKQTVEIETPAVETVTEKSVPTREELKKTGWSKTELDAAEKRGMIAKPEEKKAEVSTDAKEEPKAEESKNAQPETKEEPKKDYTHSEHLKNVDLSPEQEAELRRMFPSVNGKLHPVEAMYRMGRNERLSRQNERLARQAAEAKARQLEEEIALLKGRKVEQPQVDENGNEIDPDDQPLTAKKLREIQQKEAEERERQQREYQEKAERVSSAIRDQEEYAKSVYPDFEDTVKLAAEVMQNLDALVPEKWRRDEAIELIQQLQVRAKKAYEYEIDALTPAMIAYKIGEFHPNKGKSPNGPRAETQTDGKLERPEQKANGSLTPEQMKRIESNTQRRPSSASIPGSGGKRTISVDDIGLKEVNDMTPAERLKFKTSHPEKYAQLMRG